MSAVGQRAADARGGAAGEALVVELGAGEPAAAALVGGKAAGLDRLLRLGLPVPPALCVSAAAPAACLAAAGLAERARELRGRLPAPEAAAELARMARSTPLPDALREQLAARVEALAERAGAGVRLAVRSSATGEDGSAHSFAGAHESVLGVACEAAAVEAAVRECWASLWTERAVGYRESRALGHGVEMAVVVQALVEARAAAVVFTKDPVSGSERDAIVSWAPGLGEAIMAGGEDALTFTVHKGTCAVIATELPPDHDGELPSGTELRALVELALAVERSFGCAVDVEAAWDGAAWQLVQARPVTT